MERLAPNLFVKDINASIEFYKSLGFSTVVTMPETAPYDWAMLVNGSVTIMLQTMTSLGNTLPQIHREPGGSLLLYINMQNIQQFYDGFVHKEAILTSLETTFYGAVEFSALDPDGFVITFAENNNN